jgi:hypothetical protein
MANQATNAADTEGSVTFSSDGIREFMKCDPRCDFNIAAAPGSWMPRSETERKANVTAFVQAATLIAKDIGATMPALAQRFIAMAADAFDVDIEIGGWNPTALVAMGRIRAFAETIDTMRRRRLTQPNEQNVGMVILYTPDAAVDKDLDNHVLFQEYYNQWWSSDEGRSAPPLLKAVVKAQWILHRQGIVYQAQEKAKDELAANEPREQKAAEIAAAAAAQGAGKEDKKPSVSMSYKDAPSDVQRQIEQDAGYQPSAIGTEDGTTAEASTEIAKEQAKVEGQMTVNEHKAHLDAQGEVLKAHLDVQKEAAKEQLAEQRAEGDHSRSMELESVKESHESGMEHAKLAHESVEKHKDRQAQKEKPKSE